jgi:hypothetical protein
MKGAATHVGYSGSKKPASRRGSSSGGLGARVIEFLKRPLVTVAIGVVTGAAVVALAVWAFSAAGSGGDSSTVASSEMTDPASQDATPTPRIAIDVESIDFGRVEQNDVAEHVIEVTNAGDALLVIREVDAS